MLFKKLSLFLISCTIISAFQINSYASQEGGSEIFSEELDSAFTNISDVLFEGNIDYNKKELKVQEKTVFNIDNQIKKGNLLDTNIKINSTDKNHIVTNLEEKNYLDVKDRINIINNRVLNQDAKSSLLFMRALKFKDDEMVDYALRTLGIPYVYGGSSEKGLDCSGFINLIYKNFDIKISRSTYDMINEGKEVKKEELKPGDLIFFDTVSELPKTIKEENNNFKIFENKDKEEKDNQEKMIKRNPSHVGMYIGDNIFIHASSSMYKSVVLDEIDSPYYKPRIITYKRYR